MSRHTPMTTTVSTKGQVILPKAIRDEYSWAVGTRLVVEETADGILLRRAATFPPTSSETVFGMLAYTGQPKSLEEMEEGLMAEAARRHAGD